MADIITISKQDGDIIIRVPVSGLVFVTENHPEYPMKVLDIELFGNEVVRQLENYATQNEVEKGCTHIQELFENILEQIGDGGHDFVETIELI